MSEFKGYARNSAPIITAKIPHRRTSHQGKRATSGAP